MLQNKKFWNFWISNDMWNFTSKEDLICIENINKTKSALGMIENIDENIGNIVSVLKEKDVYDNTIIIFLSDNGPNGNRWNNDFKDRKGSTNEGGVRVPFFIQWPNNIKKRLVLTIYNDLRQ